MPRGFRNSSSSISPGLGIRYRAHGVPGDNRRFRRFSLRLAAAAVGRRLERWLSTSHCRETSLVACSGQRCLARPSCTVMRSSCAPSASIVCLMNSWPAGGEPFTMTSPLIFHDIRKPACLASQRNGALDPAQLQPIRGGMLLKPAAGKWNEMRRAAFRDGVLLMPTSTSGTYRPLRVQNKFFLSRYEPCGDDQPGAVFWNNRHWSLKEGVALAAVPGTSNHGGAFSGRAFHQRRRQGLVARPALSGWPYFPHRRELQHQPVIDAGGHRGIRRQVRAG